MIIIILLLSIITFIKLTLIYVKIPPKSMKQDKKNTTNGHVLEFHDISFKVKC